MTAPAAPATPHAVSTLPTQLAWEAGEIRAGRAQPCGKRCDDGCHGTLVCERAAHTHDPDRSWTHPRGHRIVGDVSPHVAHDADGHLVQWTCLPDDHDGLDADQRATARAETTAQTRAAATRALFDTIDPALLVTLLREGGHLPAATEGGDPH